MSNGTDEVSIPITRLDLDEANVGLGLRLAPSGNQKSEFDHRVRLASNIEARLNAVILTPTETWIFYRAIFFPKVFYPCKITVLSKHEWETILRPCTGSLLSKLGFNKHTARAIVFGPMRLGGIGMRHGYAQQGSEGVAHFLTHVREGKDIGKMLLNTLSHFNLFPGSYEVY